MDRCRRGSAAGGGSAPSVMTDLDPTSMAGMIPPSRCQWPFENLWGPVLQPDQRIPPSTRGSAVLLVPLDQGSIELEFCTFSITRLSLGPPTATANLFRTLSLSEKMTVHEGLGGGIEPPPLRGTSGIHWATPPQSLPLAPWYLLFRADRTRCTSADLRCVPRDMLQGDGSWQLLSPETENSSSVVGLPLPPEMWLVRMCLTEILEQAPKESHSAMFVRVKHWKQPKCP